MPKILVTRKLPINVENAIISAFDCSLNRDDIIYTPERLVAEAAGHDAIMTTSMDKFSAKVLESLPRSVKLIATVSAGYEHIDLVAAKSLGMIITNTPGVLTDATADIALLLLLGAARGASWGHLMVRENRWPPPSMVKPLASDVSGQRLGILGMGRIGQAIANRAMAFNMHVHYHNRKSVPDFPKATYHDSFDSMLPHCDFLSLNCALTEMTHGIVNERTIALLPRGAIVVNTSRGGVVNDDALIAALKSGHLAGAGLDVFNNEPKLDERYRSMDNVFSLPHLGSATHRTRDAMGLLALDNVKDHFRGLQPRNRIA
jgi:lactate dehydrogenase-like 2-hydroxyacid dehydrogenase